MTIFRSDHTVIDTRRLLVDVAGRVWLADLAGDVHQATYAEAVAIDAHYGAALATALESMKALT